MVPAKEGNFNHHGFLTWLTDQGAEIGMPTNPYEMIRYRLINEAGKAVTHIVYRKDSGALTWAGVTAEHYALFVASAKLQSSRPGVFLRTFPTEAAKRALKADTRTKLLERDGDICWFCGGAMGQDVTIEHLVPKSGGGGNMLANYALAHRKCNNQAGNMPLIQKIALREKMRARV